MEKFECVFQLVKAGFHMCHIQYLKHKGVKAGLCPTSCARHSLCQAVRFGRERGMMQCGVLKNENKNVGFRATQIGNCIPAVPFTS